MNTNKKLIVANWKNYIEEISQISLLLNAIITNLSQANNLVICPSFVHIKTVADCLTNSDIKIGAQNISHFDDKVSTGDITIPMLKDLGCSYVILGHSERRKLYLETNEIISKKVHIALMNNITPIVCVGEPIEIKSQSSHLEFIKTQILNSIPKTANRSKIIIAYEPIWAIGSGLVPKNEEISEVISQIKKIPSFKNTSVLYGGSVNSNNIKILNSIKNLEGFLIGKASVNFDQLSKLVF